MPNSDEDSWGCFAIAAVAAFGGWWFWENYEVKERSPEPLLLPAPAATLERPSEPILVTTAKTGSRYYVDPSTVKGPRGARIAWITIDGSDDKSVSFRTAKELIRTDCGTGETKTLSRVSYDPQGEVMGDPLDISPDEAKGAYYPPGTIGAAAPEEICKPMFD